MTKIDLDCCSIEAIDHNVILANYKDDHFVTLEDAYTIKESYEKLMPTGDIYTVINLKKQFLDISLTAQKYLARESPILKRIKATAIVLNNLPSRLIITFFIKRIKPIYPIEVFGSHKEAIAWLKTKQVV